MSRLAAVAKGEYYPTPLSVVEQIASYLFPAGSRGIIRLLDPCCGEGQAVEHLAKILQQRGAMVETWGVEISPDRAAEATRRLNLVVNAPFETCAWNHVRDGVASCVFLNPPYDYSDSGKRMEYEFLRRVTPAIVAGGVLIFIIPTTAVSWGIAEFLHLHFDFRDMRVFRFGDEEGPAGFAFNQIVIIAKRLRESFRSLYTEAAALDSTHAFVEMYSETYEYRYGPIKDRVPTALPEGTRYELPSAPRNARIYRASYTDDELIALSQKIQAQVEADIAKRLLAPQEQEELPQPLLAPRTGHIAQIVAAGLAGIIEVPGRVFKGQVIKTTEIYPDPEDKDKEIAVDRYETHVIEVSPDGVIHLSQPQAVAEFLQRHIEVFRKYIAEHFQPYGNSITPAEERILDTLSLDKVLPGMNQPGLLPKQREWAVALTRAVRRYGVGHLVAEMGSGKTRTALAAAELLGAYPVLVICPPHLVDKWVREAKDSIPGSDPIVVETIGQLQALREYTGNKLIVIISRSNIKLGPGWKPAWAVRYMLPKDANDRKQLAEAMAAYREARDRMLRNKGADNASIETLRATVVQMRRAALQRAVAVPVCPDCGTPLPRKAWDSSKPTHCSGYVQIWDEDAKVEKQPCNAALYQFKGLRRWPLADYVRRKMRGFFRMLIADEVHEYKAKSSDQGWAFGLLAHCIPAVITLTGTFFGGPASSVFWLLYRTQKAIRDEYDYDEIRWVQRYGILETVFKYEDSYGMYTAKRRRHVSTKEKPGISPEVVRYVLPTTIFASIKDLGLNLPEFREEFVLCHKSKAMEYDLRQVEVFTWNQLKSYWPHYTSAWLQWNLARPNSCFRAEVIEGYAARDILECPPVVDEDSLLPKEEWLINTVKSELSAGRKVVVYLRQTGTRDIRQRLVQILMKAGVRDVQILSESIEPRKREAWLQKNPAVLITNPRLVATGLDLVQYSTAIFYEVEYSLYTLWQACRRVWRLGQERPVKVYYLAYEGTLEEKAYALIGQKIKAAQLLYGESVNSALVEDVGDASLVMALIKAIEQNESLKIGRDVHIFADATLVTESVTGSVAIPSAVVSTPTIEEWLAARGLTLSDVLQAKRATKRTTKPPASQLALMI